MKLREKSRSHKALRSLNTGINNLRSYRASGDIHYLESANREFNVALASDPGYLPALYFRSVTCDLLGDQDIAIDGLKQVLEAKPRFKEEVQLNLGVAYFHKYHREDLSTAKGIFEEIIRASDSDPVMRLLAKSSLAQVWGQMMIQKDPEQPDLVAVAEAFSNVQRLADEVHRSLSDAPPEYRPEILWRTENALGLAEMFTSDYLGLHESVRGKLKRIDKAIEHFEKADHISPHNWAILCNLGSAWMRRGYWMKKSDHLHESSDSFQKAEGFLRQVLECVRHDYPFARYEVGRLLRLKNQYEAAIAEFNRCLSVPESQRDVSDETVLRERNRAGHRSDIFP